MLLVLVILNFPFFLGVNTSMGYAGHPGTCTYLHSEVMGAVSYNLCESGAKIWLAVHNLDKDKLSTALASVVQDTVDRACRHCPKLCVHRPGFVITPDFLERHGIRFSVVVQNAGDVVVTLPNTAHLVLNVATSPFSRDNPPVTRAIAINTACPVSTGVPYDSYCECPVKFSGMVHIYPKADGTNYVVVDKSDLALKFLCGVSNCKEIFVELSELLEHSSKEHGIEVSSLSYSCQKCSKSYANKYSYDRHAYKQHSVQVVCDRCPYVGTSFDLNRHKATCPRKFLCICRRTFYNKRVFRKHVDKHCKGPHWVGYECESCKVILMNKRKLQRHVAACTKKQSHTCRSCGKIYKREARFRTHKRLCKIQTPRGSGITSRVGCGGAKSSASEESIVRTAAQQIAACQSVLSVDEVDSYIFNGVAEDVSPLDLCLTVRESTPAEGSVSLRRYSENSVEADIIVPESVDTQQYSFQDPLKEGVGVCSTTPAEGSVSLRRYSENSVEADSIVPESGSEVFDTVRDPIEFVRSTEESNYMGDCVNLPPEASEFGDMAFPCDLRDAVSGAINSLHDEFDDNSNREVQVSSRAENLTPERVSSASGVAFGLESESVLSTARVSPLLAENESSSGTVDVGANDPVPATSNLRGSPSAWVQSPPLFSAGSGDVEHGSRKVYIRNYACVNCGCGWARKEDIQWYHCPYPYVMSFVVEHDVNHLLGIYNEIMGR